MIPVIGGGPAGLLVAKEASGLGKEIVVYEEHKRIGEPVQCGGLVSREGLKNLGVDYREAVLNEILGARAYSPSGKVLEFKKKKGYALVIDRGKLDRIIAEEAESNGAKIELGKRIENPMELAKGILIGADGANSIVAKSLGITRKYLIAYQITNRMKTDLDFVELHLGAFAPGFFAWIIPVDEKYVRMGLAYDPDRARELHREYNPRTGLKFFAHIRKYPWDPVDELGGIIPIYDRKPAVYGNIALVGDAAAQVKPSTGGGIAIGGVSARILGKVLGEDRPLSEYEKLWRERFDRELSLHLAIHKFQSRLSDDEYEELFDIATPELIKLAEKHAEMEHLGKFTVELAEYLATHPMLAMKLYKFVRYIDTSLIHI